MNNILQLFIAHRKRERYYVWRFFVIVVVFYFHLWLVGHCECYDCEVFLFHVKMKITARLSHTDNLIDTVCCLWNIISPKHLARTQKPFCFDFAHYLCYAFFGFGLTISQLLYVQLFEIVFFSCVANFKWPKRRKN